MLNAVDWTGLFILGGVVVGTFTAGYWVGVTFGGLRHRVKNLEEWREEHDNKQGKR